MSPETVPLSQCEAVQLACGLAVTLARTCDIRVLVIKGEVAHRQGVRPLRLPTDVDLLVDPRRVDDLVALLVSRGWRARPNDPRDDVFPVHSASLYHPSWPIDIDVHSRFPGFDAPPASVFERLWRDRDELSVAGVAVDVPEIHAAALIVALHALRNKPGDATTRDLDYLAGTAGQLLDGPRFVALAEETGSLGAVAPFATRVFPQCLPAGVPAPSREWILRTTAPDPAAMRLIALRSAPWRRKPHLLYRALFPSREALASVYLPALTMTRWQLARHRALRLSRTLREARAHYAQMQRFVSERSPRE